jgi:hypothetical protein
MEAGKPRRVRIDLAGDIIEITWSDRDVLLEELAFARGAKDIRERFEVGASGPVELDAEQQARLRAALDDWGEDRLQPEGIARLHAALAQAGPNS